MNAIRHHGEPAPAALPDVRGLTTRRVPGKSRTLHAARQPRRGLDAPPIHFLSYGVCQVCGKAPGHDQIVHINGRTICAACKPLAIQRIQEGAPLENYYAEQFRRPHLELEHSVRSFAVICITWGSLLMIGFGAMSSTWSRVLALICGMLMLAAGIGLENLSPWSRAAYVILAVLTLPLMPLALFLHGPVIYLLYSKKIDVLFSSAYREVISATPHLKREGPLPTWILIVLALVVGSGLGLLLLATRS